MASTPWNVDTKRQTLRIAVCGVLCVAASLCNPYGFGLYQHVGRLLVTSGVTELIEEYQPVPFGKPDARIFEWILLAARGPADHRWGRADVSVRAGTRLVWLHLSLASVRHAPLFGLAVAPGLARVLDGLLDATRLRPGPFAVGIRPWVVRLAGGHGFGDTRAQCVGRAVRRLRPKELAPLRAPRTRRHGFRSPALPRRDGAGRL
ncbi:MAG: hypothetical protein U0835_09510 [Isosphaeraceae bacterium]